MILRQDHKKNALINQQVYQALQNKHRLFQVLIAVLLLMISANVLLDFLFAQFQNSAFYISESLLFSSFWILFVPFLFLQLKFIKGKVKFGYHLLVICIVIFLHLFIYPALVWILSFIFYNHTFSYWQTFDFGLTAYFIKLMLIYSFTSGVFVIYNIKFNPVKVEHGVENMSFLKFITVSDNNNIKRILPTNEIFYFSANSPYISIHHPTKKYLQTGTLKSLETQLDNRAFVRIHKSYIVNINKTISYQSRLNGDYDLTLSNGVILRMSRNYAPVFKIKFEENHRHTTG